jgi:beta-galactosidase
MVPASWKNDPVYICFDGVLYGYKLWVNGHFAGEFASSYNRHSFNIAAFIQPGKTNTVAVQVSRLPKGYEFDENDCWSLAGIFRDVTMFSLPRIHFKDLQVNTYVNETKAILAVKAMLEGSAIYQFPKKYTVSAKLVHPSGAIVKEFVLNGTAQKNGDTQTYYQQLQIDNPLLWTAETPALYTLQLELKDNQQLIQRYTERIGIREISWSNGILQLNGQPIKLKGVDHHDLSPVNGRAITSTELLKDLTLARDANINFIRTSHYPPNPRLLELCDSMGFYVMDEVPVGFGENHLTDTTYLRNLLTRAKATVGRDKDHPCIIVWSVGNENPLTPIMLQTGNYVKSLDASRPICFPMIGSYFANNSKKFPDSIDIYAPHYPRNNDLKDWPNRFNHPMIITEYAHSFGLDFDRMQEQWEMMYATPRLAGGAVWHLFDQGILRKRTPKLTKEEAALYVWKDSVWYFDTGDINGMDGLVYADRTPQVDYWQVRKVYTPVKALDSALQYDAETKSLTFRLNNRYDFTNLSAVHGSWQLVADNQVIDSGVCTLNCLPHDTTGVTINLKLPQNLDAHYCLLKLRFTNKRSYQFYEKVIPVQYRQVVGTDFLGYLVSNPDEAVLKGNTIEANKYQFSFSKNGDQVQLKNKAGVLVIANGPYARVNRKPTVAASLKKMNTYILNKQISSISDFKDRRLTINGKHQPDSTGIPGLSSIVELYFGPNNNIDVKYVLQPDSSKNIPTLETGISFLIPATLTEFRWVGDGPYAGYPGKNALNEFGFYHLNSNDIYFAGNRQHVDCAIFSDAKGNGFALVAKRGNIAVERTDKGLLVSHNALVSGRFNKGNLPEVVYSFDNKQPVTGFFTIIPLNNPWPPMLEKLFGPAQQAAIPFKPFYRSYDQ